MPYVAPATGAVFIDGQEPKCALRARRYRFRRYSREISVAAPCLTTSRRRTTPAARRPHRWGIDFHNGYVSQDTLWNYILDSNREEGWYTDTYGLATCISNYRSTGIERFRRYYGLSAEIIHVDTRSVGFPDIIHGRER